MTRRCSHCSNNGHNLRTCPARAGSSTGDGGSSGGGSGGGGLKLFGVRLTEGVGPTSMTKSASMGNLSTAAAAAAATEGSGYASDDPNHLTSRSERKKGTPWTEEEHRMFLQGLQKLGKGDWRGISRNFVVSRTPTQVASHAQKYFIRQTNVRRKRRSSLFDLVPEMPIEEVPAMEEQTMEEQQSMHLCTPDEPDTVIQLPCMHQDPELEPVESSTDTTEKEVNQNNLFNTTPSPMAVVPNFYPAFVSMSFPLWPPPTAPIKEAQMSETHEIVKPTPVLPKESSNVDAVVDMSKLSIGEGAINRMEPSALSLKLLSTSTSRQSAFQQPQPLLLAPN